MFTERAVRLPAEATSRMNWTWNQSLSNRADAARQLTDATFVMDLGGGDVGTGFFFTGDLALTADHNVRTSPLPVFDCEYRGHRVRLAWVQEWSSERADIAVLRVVELPPDVEVRPLSAGYLPDRLTFAARCQFWAARRVMVFGYPQRGNAQEAWRVDGMIDATLPLIESREDGTVVERLNVKGSRIQRLRGMSGGAVLDLETMRAVAVEGAYDPDQGDVRGTELAQLILDAPALAPWLTSLLDDTTAPERGFVALAVRSGDPLPSLVHVSVRCAPGPAHVGAPSNGDELRLRLAGDASVWVAQYIRRFRGQLRKTFERNASFPLFSLPDGHYDSPGQLRAAMSVAYLARVIDDALRYDLSLPVEFPETLMVCAAGSGEAGGPAAGAEHWLDAVHREQWPNPTTVWHPAGRARAVPETPPLPPTVKLVAVDGMEQMARSLLGELEAFLPHSAAPAAISGVMHRGLAELHTIETLIEVASQEALGKQVRLGRMEEKIAVRERQVKWLDETGMQVRERLRKRRSAPPAAELLDQFTQLEEARKPAAQSAVVVVPSDFEERSDRCVVLYRRLARLYHPDVQPAESEMFLQLVSHRWDLVWLEALDGANEPLRIETAATDIERRVDVLVDRLYSLREAAERLDRKVAAKEQELHSLGGRAAVALDDEIQSRRAVLSILEHDIDRGWRALNYAAGWDRAGR